MKRARTHTNTQRERERVCVLDTGKHYPEDNDAAVEVTEAAEND